MSAFLVRSVLAVALLSTPGVGGIAPDPVYDPLQLYEGTWIVTPAGSSRSTATITNECGRIGRLYGCQQTVNGKTGGVILFVPRDTIGKYFTQALARDGSAMGRGELTITGSHWEYLGHGGTGDSVTYFRTINDFTGSDRIHFELATSHDGVNWTVTQSGDEVRKMAAVWRILPAQP